MYSAHAWSVSRQCPGSLCQHHESRFLLPLAVVWLGHRHVCCPGHHRLQHTAVDCVEYHGHPSLHHLIASDVCDLQHPVVWGAESVVLLWDDSAEPICDRHGVLLSRHVWAVYLCAGRDQQMSVWRGSCVMFTWPRARHSLAAVHWLFHVQLVSIDSSHFRPRLIDICFHSAAYLF